MHHFGSLNLLGRKASAHEHFSDEMLVSTAQAGQEWAFAELCSRCSTRILVSLYRITKNREDAEDVLQESILKAFVHLRSFNRASTFSTWLTRISINSALMMLRRKRIRPQVSIEVPSDVGNESLRWEIPDKCANQEDLYIQHENRARLKAAISHLPRTYRDIIAFRQESEGSLKEIAAHAGISIGAAKSRVLRATRELRKSLAEGEAVSAKQPKCL
jgi:RNA polymerase sigma-70 factor (ECF subfamily)